MDYLDEDDRVKKVAEKNRIVEKQMADKPYTIMLTVLGIACIIFATIITIDKILVMGKEAGTLYVVGVALVGGAYLWQQKDAKDIVNINKRIDDDDGDSYQEERIK